MINKSKNESKLIRVNTTDESNLIGKRRSVYMHNRQLKFHDIDKIEQETPDENKDKDNDIKNESYNKEKENKSKKRGAFSKYLFLRGSNNKLGGSSKSNFLSENLLRRTSLKVPEYSALREKYNKRKISGNHPLLLPLFQIKMKTIKRTQKIKMQIVLRIKINKKIKL